MHEIYVTRDGKASMAFVGETPWHDLGNRLTKGAPISTWKREAGFVWTADMATPEFLRADGTRGTVDNRRVIYRSDTGAPLSIMGDGYKPVQPGEVIEFFRDLTEEQGFHLHTAGVLRGGQKLWAMASNDTSDEVVPGDRVKGNVLLTTSLDGTSPTIAGFTSVRVVCANTLGIALGQGLRDANGVRLTGRRGMGRTSHRSVFDAAAVKREIGLVRETFAEFMEHMRNLAAVKINPILARDVLRNVFGQPILTKSISAGAADANPIIVGNEAKSILDRISREQKSVARCLALYGGEARGADHPGVKGTAWGLLNAVTEHVDFEQGRARDSRLDSAWFGRGADFKAATLDALLAL